MKVNLLFKGHDFWVGFYYERKGKILYFCPLPMIVLKFDLNKTGKKYLRVRK